MNRIKLNTILSNVTIIRRHSSSNFSSKFIRQQFLDFFIKENGHNFVRSSSVIPYCDPTLSFTNAGMNQFKNILIGKQDPKYTRVANSQKCIRVGGKHNDLNVVGTDSYHHTFFEMLGNWSFGDYFKKEACGMAWELLTKVYKIPPERLYVTFFKGDERLNLPADIECKEIWRSLGVPENRIIGFGLKENFWEMGATGPCGGCSEIHIDHLPSFNELNRATDVNQDKSDLTEIWNIVFIEYFRNADGTITKLPKKHVDTGMGFERLVAFLQGKQSNYDSDLFTPIFDSIHKTTGVTKYSGSFIGANSEIDTAYRIIADHSRMAAIALADGMFPEQNQKLRRVLRKCFNISEKEFKTGNLLPSTIPVVAEILGETFTELNEKMPLVLDLVKYEEELYKSLRQMMSKDVTRIVNENPKLAELELFDYPGFVQGYGEVLNFKKNNDKMSGEFMYYIHSSFGFDLEFIERLASLENMKTDRKAFETKIAEVKRVSSGQSMSDDVILSLDNILNVKTDESRKYNYIYDESAQIYKLPKVKAKVLKIIDGKDSIENSKDSSNKTIKLVLDKSPFYYESGGQEADKGTIIIGNEEFPLIYLSKIKNCILHEIQLKDNSNISVNDEIELQVNENRRSGLIRNHSATHLLNSAIRKITNSPVYQKSSLVSEDKLRMEIACFGPKLKPEITQQIEDLIRFNINTKPLNASIRVINSQALENENDVIMVPGEIYPDEGIRLITFGDVSKELCCGTHVFNTQELLEFTFLGMKTTGRNSYLFTAATGETAKQAISFGDQLINELNQLSAGITSQNFNDVLTKVREISAKLSNSNLQISLNKKLKCHEIIAEVKEKFKHESREILGVLLDIEMKDLLERSPHSPYLIHSLECSDLMKSVSLLKATRYVRDRPVMIFSVTDNSIIKARCCVPSKLATESFNAEIWLREASKILRSSISPPKDQNPWETCNMKEKKVKPDRIDETLNKAIESADDFAKNFFKRQLKQAENI